MSFLINSVGITHVWSLPAGYVINAEMRVKGLADDVDDMETLLDNIEARAQLFPGTPTSYSVQSKAYLHNQTIIIATWSATGLTKADVVQYYTDIFEAVDEEIISTP